MRDVSEWWWKVAHDTRNSGVGKGLDLLEMRDGAYSLRRGLSDCEMRANFSQCGEFMYVRGSYLWDCGENGNGGLWVEPMQGENVLKK